MHFNKQTHNLTEKKANFNSFRTYIFVEGSHTYCIHTGCAGMGGMYRMYGHRWLMLVTLPYPLVLLGHLDWMDLGFPPCQACQASQPPALRPLIPHPTTSVHIMVHQLTSTQLPGVPACHHPFLVAWTRLRYAGVPW